MEHVAEPQATPAVETSSRVVVHPTQFRSRTQRWIGWTAAAVVLLAVGVVAEVPLLLVLGGLAAAGAARSGLRLVRSLRRLDDVGLTRWSANVVMMLLPPHGVRRHHGLAHVHVPDAVERTPEAVLRHVLADEGRRPTVAPWVRHGSDEAPTGVSGPARVLWLVPGGALVGWCGAAVVLASVDTSTTVRAVALGLAALPVVVAAVVVARHRVIVDDGGRLEIRRALGSRVIELEHLLQASGWTWSLDADDPVEGRPQLHAATISLVLGDGSHATVHPRTLADDQVLAQAVRHWVVRQGAVVTADLAYALGFSADPRDDGQVRVVPDDRWMRRPLRRLRAAAVHVAAASAPAQPLAVGAAVLWLAS